MKDFFFLQSLFGRDICSLFMAVTMPGSLVRVNKGRGWQIVAAVLSNIHCLVYLFDCERVCKCKQKGDVYFLHLSTHMLHSNMHEIYSKTICIIFELTCLFRPWTVAGSWEDNQYICLASLHNPLVFHVNSNWAMLEHKNVRYGWTTSNPSSIKEYCSFL